MIQLGKKWTIGARIGEPSGFGRVFEATTDDGTAGVVKLIPKRPGADRELLFEDLVGVPNVVPIIDSGGTAHDWVIAMPKAECSLRAKIESAGGQFSEDEAVPILIDVARALAELDGRVVHRDLKPENVLLLDGAWSLADFGIARYAEASTAPDTWKATFTAHYAAPERWRFERATSSTDVYSLGVMACELLMGARPFPGPGFDELRDQHLHQDAPEVTGVPPALASLIAECLFKPAGSRPTPKNVLARLERTMIPPFPGAGRLQAANRAVRVAQGHEHAKASSAMSEGERRQALFDTAARGLKAISVQVRQAVIDNAETAAPATGTAFDDWAIGLGTAVIGMDPATKPRPEPWGPWKPKVDVIAFGTIGVIIPQDRYGYRGRIHALWYCDAQKEGAYRWYETGFMVSPLIRKRTDFYPFAFEPNENAGKALSNAMAEWQLAWPFMAIDQGEEAQFIERWLDWFGQAAVGELRQPSSMPERSTDGSWRRG